MNLEQTAEAEADMKRTRRTGQGFTLVELLAVVAIIGILAAFGFVNVAAHQKRLKLTENDNIAREIFVAAQNQLTQSKSTGEWDKLYAEHASDTDPAFFGTKYTGTISDSNVKATDPDWYTLTNTDVTGGQSEIADLILPLGATDETVRSGGHYVILYDAKNAEVYAVLYTDNANGVGVEDITNLIASDGTVLSTDERVRYQKNGANDLIGIYTGTYAEAQKGSGENKTDTDGETITVKDPTVQIVNGPRLLLVVTDPNAADSDTSLTVTRSISLYDAKSGASLDFSGAAPDASASTDKGTQYVYILDSIVQENGNNRHFSNLLSTYKAGSNFVAGDNIFAEVSVTVTKTDTDGTKYTATSDTVQSNIANSLFADDSSTNQALIANGRQLENLSTTISGVGSVADAQVRANISWSSGDSSFLSSLASQASKYGLSGSTTTVLFQKQEGTGSENIYYGIVNDGLQTFHGNGNTLSNFTIGKENNDDITGSGLIAQANGSLSVSKLTLSNITVNGTSDGSGTVSSGALLGLFTDKNNTGNQSLSISDVTIKNCTVGDQKNPADITHAGLVLGAINEENLVLSKVITDGTNVVAGSMAGGLVGRANNTQGDNNQKGDEAMPSVVITGCTLGGDALTVTASQYAGGLLGQYSLYQAKDFASNDKISLLSNEISATSLTVTAGASADKSAYAAGGLVGSVTDATSANINGCKISSNKISITSSGTDTSGKNLDRQSAGGAIGEIHYSKSSSDSSIVLSRVTVGADKKESIITVDASKDKGYAGGLIGTLYQSSGKTRGSADAPAVTVSSSTVQSDSIQLKGELAAGGLLADSTDVYCKLTSCTVSSFVSSASTNQVTISASNTGSGAAGGMLGFASASSSGTGIGDKPVLSASQDVVKSKVLNVKAPAAAGGWVGRIQNLAAVITNSDVLSQDKAELAAGAAKTTSSDGTITITSASGTAGGFFGEAANEKNDLGSQANPALQITGSAVETNQLSVDAKNEAGGFAGLTSNLVSEITTSSVYGGRQGLVKSESADAGGFIGKQGSSAVSTFTDDVASVLVKTSAAGNYGIGGFAGALTSSSVTTCYAAGRTSEGSYQPSQVDASNQSSGSTDVSDTGNSDQPYDRNVYAAGTSGAVHAGGFVGTTAGSTSISSIYSTCSVRNDSVNAGSSSGGFVGANSGSISSSYCTGLVTGSENGNAGIFAGTSKEEETGNYCLSDLANNPNQVSGDGQTVATAVTHGDSNIAGTAAESSALPYDSTLQPGYFFKTLAELSSASKISWHVGDWPTVFTAKSFDQEYGILYYEAVQHGDTKNADIEYFYHGYMVDLTSSGKDTPEEVSTRDTISAGNITTLNSHGLDSAPAGGDYVVDDGYLILVPENADLTQVGLSLDYATSPDSNSISYLVKNQKLTQYADLQTNLNIHGYQAYSLDKSKLSSLWWSIKGGDLKLYSDNVYNNWTNQSASLYINPYFADCLDPNVSNVQTNYSIRSASQLYSVLNTGICVANGINPSAVSIDMDITLDKSTVQILNYPATSSETSSTYPSATASSLVGTISSTETANRSITWVNGSTANDHYRLIGINQPIASSIQQSGALKNIHFVSANTSSIVTTMDHTSKISGCYIENSTFTGTGAIVETIHNSGGSTISSCDVVNSTISGSGIAGTVSAATISNCNVYNDTLGVNGFAGSIADNASISSCRVSHCSISNGNGFATSSGSGCKIENCSVVNSNIGLNGFLQSNYAGSTISGCGVYADNTAYSSYQSNTVKKYAPSDDYKDSTAYGDSSIGYHLVKIGSTNQDSVAGFVNSNAGTVSNCFVAGQVIGNRAAGFFDTNTGTIQSSYANTLVYATTTGAGFGITQNGSSISQCHSVGKIMTGTTQIGFIDSIQAGQVTNCYSAIWSMQDDTENTYLFTRSISNKNLLSGNGYLSDIDFSFNQTVANGVTTSQVAGYTDQELTEAAAASGDLGQKAAASVVYKQYTTQSTYPYPMPSGMTSYGDWSHSNGYTIVFDANAPDGATVTGTMQNMTGVSYAQDTPLTLNQYVCTDNSQDTSSSQYEDQRYHFAYWTLTKDGTGKSYSDGAAVRALAKEGQTVTLYAQWIKGFWSFSYTGSYQVFTAPVDGVYKLETWGAQGGNGMSGKQGDSDIQARDSTNTTKKVAQGGKGAYASNYVSLKKGQTVYVYVGGKGDMAYVNEQVIAGGWNGGGNAKSEISSAGDAYLWGSGGGATSMTILNSGEDIANYPTLASYVNNKSDVTVVAGGGGGAGATVTNNTNNGGAGGDQNGVDGSGESHGMGGSSTAGGSGDARYYSLNYTYSYWWGNAIGKINATPTSNNLIAYGSFGAGGGGNNTEDYVGTYSGTFTPNGGRSTKNFTNAQLTGAVNGAGGGGGWYGGGMGYLKGSSGGGGSSYINQTTTASWYASAYASQATMINGNSSMPSPTDQTSTITGREGDGFARISIVTDTITTSADADQ